jgi:chemotaxis signal transduction protein
MSGAGDRPAGTVVRVGGERWFLPASAAKRVARLPPLTRVPGAPADLLGIGQVAGEIVPVLAVRPGLSTPAVVVVVAHLGEQVAIAVDEVLHTGAVDADEAHVGAVAWGGTPVYALDVAALCARAQRSGWARADA